MPDVLPLRFYRRTWFWIVILISLALLSYAVYLRHFSPLDVRTEPAKRQPLTITVTATSTGTIKSDYDAKVTARRQGRINKLSYDEGDTVAAGTVIAELDRDEARYSMLKTEASQQRAESVLSQLKAGYEAFKVEVERGIDRARATFSEVESRRKRYLELKERGYISDMDVEAVHKEYEVGRANLAAALAMREQVTARAGEVKAQEAAVNEARHLLSLARLNYDYSLVVSPLAGVITARPVKLGEGVIAGTVVATVVSREALYIEAFIDEADVAKLRPGQQVLITMDAYPGKTFKGEVYRISPVVLGGKQETRTFEVRTRFNENPPVVKPGMSADVEIVVESIDRVLAVPAQAVIEKDRRRFVYVVRNSRAALVPVGTGRSNWSLVEVSEGLVEGEEVILNPDLPGLRDRVPVRRRPVK